jgi:hypothetical protein
MSSLKFTGKFESGLEYEVHCATSFSGMEELAIIIGGKPVSIITVNKKKNGGVEIKPVTNTKLRIPGTNEITPTEPREGEVPSGSKLEQTI